MTSEDFIKKFKMLKDCLEHFLIFSKISEDFQKFRKLIGILVFALSGAFS